MKNFLFSAIVFVCALFIAVGFAEVLLRIKNSSMKNYDVEMWRYSRELKHASPDPILGHEHNRNASATLQSVNIRTDDLGLRGAAVGPKQDTTRRILLSRRLHHARMGRERRRFDDGEAREDVRVWRGKRSKC